VRRYPDENKRHSHTSSVGRELSTPSCRCRRRRRRRCSCSSMPKTIIDCSGASKLHNSSRLAASRSSNVHPRDTLRTISSTDNSRRRSAQRERGAAQRSGSVYRRYLIASTRSIENASVPRDVFPIRWNGSMSGISSTWMFRALTSSNHRRRAAGARSAAD